MGLRNKATRLAKSIGPTSVDQGLSSLTNLAASVFVARNLSVEEFGVFGITLATSLVAITLIRAATADVLMVSGASKGAMRGNATATVTAALGISIAFAVVLAILAIFLLGTPLGAPLLFLAVGTPAIVIQDVSRYVTFKFRVVRYAIISDLTWLVVLVISAAVLPLIFGPSLPIYLVAWLGSGLVAAIVICIPLRMNLLHRRVLTRIYRQRAGYSAKIFFDQLAVVISQQGIVYLLAGVIGLVGSAAYRGVQVIYGPINVLTTGIATAFIPRLRDAWDRAAGSFRRQAMTMGLFNVAVVVVLTQAIAFIPGPLGTALLGDTWAVAESYLRIYSLTLIGQAINFGAIAGLRVIGHAGSGLLVRSIVVPSTLVAVAVAAIVGGLDAALWTQAACSLTSGAIWWMLFLRKLRGEQDARLAPA